MVLLLLLLLGRLLLVQHFLDDVLACVLARRCRLNDLLLDDLRGTAARSSTMRLEHNLLRLHALRCRG